MKQLVTRWGGDPIYIPRWVLTVKYALFAVLGVFAIILGLPTLDLTTFDGYTGIWGVWVTLTSIVAGFGSLSRTLEPYERWGSTALVSFLIVYTIFAFALGRGTGAFIVLIITLLPGFRSVHLLTRTGLPKPEPVP